MPHNLEDQPEPLHDTLQERLNRLVCRVLNLKTSDKELISMLFGQSTTEWEAFRQAACQLGVSILVNQRLLGIKDEIKIPESLLTAWHQEVLTSSTRNMLMLHEAGIILKMLRSQGLDVIVLKGLYLVENVYQNVSLRKFSDLDLLVRREKVNAVIACMNGLGYAVETYFDSQDENRDIKHVPPMTKPGGPYVEIHWTILEEDEPFTIDTEGLWQRAMPAGVAGVDVLSLGVEDLLLHLCVHLGYQHHLKIGLHGLYDIAEVLWYFQGQVDWDRLTDIASQWGVEHVIWLVFKLADELLGAEVPQMVYARLVAATVQPDVLMNARAQLLAGEGQAIAMTPDLAKLATARSLGGRLMVMLSRVFIPRQSLARLYNVSPKSLKIVGCYFKRFADLVKQYGPSLSHVFHKDQAVMAGVADEETTERLSRWMGKNEV